MRGFRGTVLILGCAICLTGCGGREEKKPKSYGEVKDISDYLYEYAASQLKESIDETEALKETAELSLCMNASGFEPGSAKVFVLKALKSDGIDPLALSFDIVEKTTENSVFDGKIERLEDKDPDSSEEYFYGHFDELSKPGNYKVRCFYEGEQILTSKAFEIEKSHYVGRLNEVSFFLTATENLPGILEDRAAREAYFHMTDLVMSYDFFEKEKISNDMRGNIIPKTLENALFYADEISDFDLLENTATKSSDLYLYSASFSLLSNAMREYDSKQASDLLKDAKNMFKAAEDYYAREVTEEAERMEAKGNPAGDTKEGATGELGNAKESGTGEAGNAKEGATGDTKESAIGESTTEISPELRDAQRFFAAASLYRSLGEKKYRAIAEEYISGALTADEVETTAGGAEENGADGEEKSEPTAEGAEENGADGKEKSETTAGGSEENGADGKEKSEITADGAEENGADGRNKSETTGDRSEAYPSYFRNFSSFEGFFGALTYLTTAYKTDRNLSSDLMDAIMEEGLVYAKEIKNDVMFFGASNDESEEIDECLNRARILLFSNLVSQSTLYVEGAELYYGYYCGLNREGKDYSYSVDYFENPCSFILNGFINSYLGSLEQ